MSTLRTSGKLVIIGIALVVLGVTPANPGRSALQAQTRTTQGDQGLVKTVTVKPLAPRRTIASKPPSRLSSADKQRLLQSVLGSLRQQHKMFPNLNLDKVFPLVVPTSTLSVPAGIMLSPTEPFNNSNGGINRLIFGWAESVGTGPENGASFGFYGALIVEVFAVPGRTYLLDFTADQGSYPIVFQVRGAQIEMDSSNGHILIPTIASGPKLIVSVASHGWKFYSVEISQLNLN